MASEIGQERFETRADIVADLRARARRFIGYHGVGWSEGGRLMSLADRIESAAKRDERLMLSLMLYAVEDYVEDWAGPNYKSCVQSACKRLGIEYHSSARQLWEQIEEKIKRMEGSANEKPE